MSFVAQTSLLSTIKRKSIPFPLHINMPLTEPQENVDLIIVGLGNPTQDCATSRVNAGYIFVDYLANCINMQEVLFKKEQESPGSAIVAPSIVPQDFQAPVFRRSRELDADIAEITLVVTESDFNPHKVGGDSIIRVPV